MAPRKRHWLTDSPVFPNRPAFHHLKLVWHLPALGIAQTHICLQQQCKAALLCNHLSPKEECHCAGLFLSAYKPLKINSQLFYFFCLNVMSHNKLCWLSGLEGSNGKSENSDIKHFVTWWSHPDSLPFPWCGGALLSAQQEGFISFTSNTRKDEKRHSMGRRNKESEKLGGKELVTVGDPCRQLWRCLPSPSQERKQSFLCIKRSIMGGLQRRRL